MTTETTKRGAPKKEVTLSVAERKRLSRQRQREAAAGIVKIPKPKPASKVRAESKPATKTRAPRSDSATVAVRAMQNVSLEPLMPPHMVRMPADAFLYWPGIIESRARDDWNPVDLITAANLAKYQAQMAEEELKVEFEGRVIEDYLGKTLVNPRFSVIETLSKKIMATMRSLRMGGKPAGEIAALAGGRAIEGEARKMMGVVDDSDGLLA